MAGYCASYFVMVVRYYCEYDSRRVEWVLQIPMRDLPLHGSVEGEVGVETARLPSYLGIDRERTSACRLVVVYCSLLS